MTVKELKDYLDSVNQNETVAIKVDGYIYDIPDVSERKVNAAFGDDFTVIIIKAGNQLGRG